MKNFKVSEFLHFQPVDVDKDISIGWNRFFPTIFMVNRFALELLEAVRDRKPLPQNKETEWFVNELFKYKFIYDSDTDPTDPSGDAFLRMMEKLLAALKKKGDEFYRLKKAYDGITIFNDECNLACPYCVNQYKRKHVPVKRNAAERLKIVRDCIDRFVSRRLAKGLKSEPVKVSFNGGEILLAWREIKEIVQWLTDTYRRMNFEFHMNTNLTLMTGEIARFLAQHNFKIDISIDGYGRAHDRTRKYHNGKGSFSDILKGLAVYREFNEKNPITAFQGTIDFIDEFDPEELYEMAKYGFLQARLAPNLLNVSEADARKKAGLMGKFLELNERHPFQVMELFFSKAKDRINQDDYFFAFNCHGLSCFPQMTMYLNISTLQVSLLCAYVHDAWFPLEEVGYDMYNPEIWHRAYGFIKERAQAIKKYCLDCHLVGLCSGGCIYTGLDNENKINKAACAYQEELWRIYIEKVYRDREQS
jgi:radical SAM protein with 4Fe4S-binding SPASM domain